MKQKRHGFKTFLLDVELKLKRFKKQYSTMVVIIFLTLGYNVSLVHAQHLNICDVIIETDE